MGFMIYRRLLLRALILMSASGAIAFGQNAHAQVSDDLDRQLKKAGVPLQPVDPEAIKATLEQNKKFENRMMVKVPLDPMAPPHGRFKNAIVRTLTRFIPAVSDNGTPVDISTGVPESTRDKLTIVGINGGPGQPHTLFRRLEFDYEDPSKNTPGKDRLAEILKSANFLTFDQLGNPGTQEVRVDMSNREGLNYKLMSRFFNDLSFAYSLNAAIEANIEAGNMNKDNFIVLGHSYGESVMWAYAYLIAMGKVKYLPKGLVGADGLVPFFDSAEQWLAARKEQIAYSERIQKWSIENNKEKFSTIVMDLQKTFKSLKHLGADPNATHLFYITMLASATNYEGIYNQVADLRKKLNEAPNEAEAIKIYIEWRNDISDYNLIVNHIETVTGLVRGHTSAEMAAREQKIGGVRKPWWILSYPAFAIEASYHSEKVLADLLRKGKLYLPPQITAPQVRELIEKKGIAVTVQSGKHNTVVTSVGIREKFNKLIPDASIVITEDGHRDVFTADGFKRVVEKSGGYEPKKPKSRGGACAKGAGGG